MPRTPERPKTKREPASTIINPELAYFMCHDKGTRIAVIYVGQNRQPIRISGRPFMDTDSLMKVGDINPETGQTHVYVLRKPFPGNTNT